MVELNTRKREIRGDGGNHHEELGLKRISCVSEFTILNRAGTSPDLAGNNTKTRSSKPNQVSCNPDFSGPRLYSPYRSNLHPPSLVLATVPTKPGPSRFGPGLYQTVPPIKSMNIHHII